MRLANDFAAQARDLTKKIAVLESEQEKSTTSMQKLVRAVAEKKTALEEKIIVLDEKTIALEEKTVTLEEEEKEKELAEKETRLAKIEEELTLIHSREVDQEAFTDLMVEKLLQTTDFGEMAVKMSSAATAVEKQKVFKALMA